MDGSKARITRRMGGALLVGVFFVNLYLGLFDANLYKFQPLHSYLNWVIAAVTLGASMILLINPMRKVAFSILAGIIWPLVYLASLAIDVESRLCLGSGTNCFPSVNAAYQYLILNSPSAGWNLIQGVVPLAIALNVGAISAEIYSLYSVSRKRTSVKETVEKGIEKSSSSQLSFIGGSG
jgi:hypothetical protein